MLRRRVGFPTLSFKLFLPSSTLFLLTLHIGVEALRRPSNSGRCFPSIFL
nr:MAG TPA: hypothetical protein [Caudoviricetes sp.]